ncbi:MAG TPA: hypothetical protein G4N94_09475 [Caldilineae bacterium]|nr:hypothetical protein [Caldilineae bacterium]
MRRQKILLTTLLAISFLIASFPRAGFASLQEVTRLRIGVTEDGIQRITPADLLAAGVEPTELDPRLFAMTSRGLPVAIQVIGEADGHFDNDDYIEFFGQKYHSTIQDEKYTDENVYWLDLDGAPGLRIKSVDATPQGDIAPSADFATTVRAEENNHWYTQHTMFPETKDTWFWDRIQPLGAGQGITRTYPYTIPYPASNTEFLLRVDENARKNVLHRTTIALNETPLVDETWSGKRRKVFTTTIPADVAIHGLNDVTIGAINAPDAVAVSSPPESSWQDDALAWLDSDAPASTAPSSTSDDVYLNWWEIEYRRLFQAWQGQLDFHAETNGLQEYRASGWDSPDIAIWDISDPFHPKRLTGAKDLDTRTFLPLHLSNDAGQSSSLPAMTAQGLPYTAYFRVDQQVGDHFWLQQTDTIATPASIRLYTDPGLRHPERGADAVIVTSSELRPAAERLAAWHEAHGRRAIVAEFSQVIDEFNDGIYHPRAVPTMLAWAQNNWPGPAPQFLTLVGDGHWNFKGYAPDRYPPQPNIIPPYLAWTDPDQGEVPTDNAYADLDGDRRPDIAVGRLAVNTLAEASVVVDKIIAYDESVRSEPWQQRALFVADNADSAGDFPAVSDAIINDYLPADLVPERTYLFQTVPDADAATAAIINAINNGVWMVQFTGHGAPHRWTHEGIWTLNDISALNNADKLPIVMTFNCLDGYFTYPVPRLFSIAETMQRLPNGGAVATISPSGLGYTYQQNEFRQKLMTALFADGTQEIGAALMIAKQRYYDLHGPHNLIDTMTLFGDPAMRLPVPAQP